MTITHDSTRSSLRGSRRSEWWNMALKASSVSKTMTLISGTPLDGVWQAECWFPQYSQQGDWEASITVVDAAGKKTHEWSDEAFDRMIAVNLRGVWLCMKHEIPQMLAQGGGVIVNTGSIAGLIGLPTSSAYVAAKHGVLGLTKTAALEYATDKIRVNAVCPGYIETKMTEDTMRRRGTELMTKVPFGRMGKPEEIGEMVLWFCSDRASYVSGACYNVDGGYMAI